MYTRACREHETSRRPKHASGILLLQCFALIPHEAYGGLVATNKAVIITFVHQTTRSGINKAVLCSCNNLLHLPAHPSRHSAQGCARFHFSFH